MLEFYVAVHKRWKSRAPTKRRRVLLNTLSNEGEPEWGCKYIYNVKSESRARESISAYRRYLSRQVGRDAGEVYSDLSHRRIYRHRQHRHLLREAFLDEMQGGRGWREYRRGLDGRIEIIPKNTYIYLPLQLRAHDTGFSGKYLAKYLVWYPSHKSTRIVIGKGDPPITGYLWAGIGWYGYYTEDVKVYKQELVLDSKGRPLFTKEQYEVHAPDGRPRVIPAGGPLLREVVTTKQVSEWKPIKDYELSAYGHSRKLELLKEELQAGKSYE